jgi:hypothetical protein
LFSQGTLRKHVSQIVDIACHYFNISKLAPPLGEQFFDLMFVVFFYDRSILTVDSLGLTL